jgi:hypothetical protein
MTSFCEKPFKPVANDSTLYLGNQIPFEFLRPASGFQNGVELLKSIAKVCGAVLVIWLLFATYGLDLSPGFF